MSNPFKIGDPVYIKNQGSWTGSAARIAAMPILFVVKLYSDVYVSVGPRLESSDFKPQHDQDYWNFNISHVSIVHVLSDAEITKAAEALVADHKARNVAAVTAVENHKKWLVEEATRLKKLADEKEASLKHLSKEGRRVYDLFSKNKELFGCQSDGAVEFVGALVGDNLSAVLGTKIMEVK